MTFPFERFTKHIVEGTAREAIQERVTMLHGTHSALPILTPYVVIDTIFDPSIIDDVKITYWQNEVGVSNIQYAKWLPRNTIIAQQARDGNSTPVDAPMFLFPLFAEMALPCVPGEQVWVIFPHRETKRQDLGYWLCRIVGPNFVEDANHVHMPRVHDPGFNIGTQELANGAPPPAYEFRPGRVVEISGERFTDPETITLSTSDEQVFEKLMTSTDGGRLRHYEPVPRFRKRPGDIVIEGRNNALIVLGRHRTGPVASYTPDEAVGKIPSIPESDKTSDGAAIIDIVVGRGMTPATGGNVVDNSLKLKELSKSSAQLVEKEGDPDFSADAARILVSQKINVDADFGLSTLNSEFGAGTFQGTEGEPSVTDTEEGSSAVVVKADKIRLIARSDIELIVSSYEQDPDTGRMMEITDPARCAAIVIKANGDIVLRPSTKGYIKLGGDEADKAIVCTDFPAKPVDGVVDADPIQTTMAGFFGGTKIPGQGVYASKVLVVGPSTPKK